jgi:hypothetical protein
VSTAASLEFGFSQPGYIICETVHNDVPWRKDVVDPHAVETASGNFSTRIGDGTGACDGECGGGELEREKRRRA